MVPSIYLEWRNKYQASLDSWKENSHIMLSFKEGNISCCIKALIPEPDYLNSSSGFSNFPAILLRIT